MTETADLRVHRILDEAGWSAELRDVHPTAVRLVDTDLGARAVELLDDAANSSGGVVYGDSEGRVVYRQMDWAQFDPARPVDATIGNVDPDDVCPSGWERSFQMADIATRVIAGRKGSVAQQFDDPDSQAIYGVETYAKTDLSTFNDLDITALGERWLTVLSPELMPRVSAVLLDAGTDPATRDLCAIADPRTPTRLRCRHRRPDGTIVFDTEYFVTSITHAIDPANWTVRLGLDDATPYQMIGDRWNQANWNSAVWAGVTN